MDAALYFDSSRYRHVLAATAWLACSIVACDFHDGKFDDEFNAGGANPYSFPPPYRGAGAARQTAASGVFTEIGAYAKGKRIGYYSFPFAPGQIQTTGYSEPKPAIWPDAVVDPLRVSGPGTDFRKQTGNPVPVPLVYNFDPPGGMAPFAARAKCSPPSGYRYDQFYEAFPQDTQWNIFTFLPDRFATFPFGTLPDWVYRPVVAEVPVTTVNMGCQSAKSERALLALADEGKVQIARGDPEQDGTRLGKPTDDRFLAWALIDPGAAVVRVGETRDIMEGGKVSGTSVQKYGWYGQFVVAYLDGGYIPVEPGPIVQEQPTKRMRTQRLYYPRSEVKKGGKSAPGAFGQGYDVLQASRFDDGDVYSPVCELWTYALPAVTAVADLPKDEATIVELANSTLEPARTVQAATAYTPSPAVVPRYVFCLQAAPRIP